VGDALLQLIGIMDRIVHHSGDHPCFMLKYVKRSIIVSEMALLLRNDPYRVEWGVKLYSLASEMTESLCEHHGGFGAKND